MSDTPETDAAVIASGGSWSVVLRETCRRLERERAEARDEAALWKWHWMAARKEVENLIKEETK